MTECIRRFPEGIHSFVIISDLYRVLTEIAEGNTDIAPSVLRYKGSKPSFPPKADNNMAKEALICQIIYIRGTNRQFIQLSDISFFDYLPLKILISIVISLEK